MKVTIIIGPRRCGKHTKARELAAQKSDVWLEYQNAPGTSIWQARPGYKDNKPQPADGKKQTIGALLFIDAHEMPHREFLRRAGDAVRYGADLILTACGTLACNMHNGRPAWLDALMLSDMAEVIELQPQTDAQKDFARICAIIESPTGGV